jgi:quinol monooxygenase YgiN
VQGQERQSRQLTGRRLRRLASVLALAEVSFPASGSSERRVVKVLLIVGTIRLPADLLDAARPVMAAMVEASRAEAGCLEYSYAVDVLDRGLIHVKECWTDRAALDAHFKSVHIANWRASWPVLDIGERNLHLYEVGNPQPI